MDAYDVVINSPAFKLKGSLCTLMTLQLINTDLHQVEKQLLEKTKEAPKFFDQTPIVIDLQDIKYENRTFDFPGLLTLLQKYHLVPFGFKGGNVEQQSVAKQLGLALLPETKPKTNPAEIKRSSPRIVTQPIRSGQQIYAQGCDLIVCSSVSMGAELLADGNIHVYGYLRGRVLAGVMGDTQARIFCNYLEAELVSIAGHYKISEHLKETHWGEPAMIYLQEDRLQIDKL